MKRANRNKIGFGLLVVALLIAAAALDRGSTGPRAPEAAFANAMPSGGKGLALLLGRLGYAAKVQNAPLQALPKDARVWLILSPKTQFAQTEAQQLLAWVKAGNTLIFCADRSELLLHGAAEPPTATGISTLIRALGIGDVTPEFNAPGAGGLPTLSPLTLDVPSNYRSGVKAASGSKSEVFVDRPHLLLAGAPGGTLAKIPYGKGRVWVATDAWLFTNYCLAQPNNATLVANLIRVDVPRGAVYFDERQHDNNRRPPAPDTLISRLKKPPVSYALWQLLAAGLLMWAFAARRLGAAVPLPTRGPVTRASQFAQAMGGLFAKTGRPGAAASIIGDNFRRRLAQRLGLSPSERDEVLARRAHEVGGVPYEVVDRLLLQTRTPAQSEAQALRDAQEMDAVLARLEGRV